MARLFFSLLLMLVNIVMLVSWLVLYDDYTSEAKALPVVPETHPIQVTVLPSITKPVIDYPDQEDVLCLATNIYHEARSESRAGKESVAQVVVNRVADPTFPNTVCEVVYQARVSRWHLENTGKIVPLRHQCQFSWYCDGKSDYIDMSSEVWWETFDVAWQVLLGRHNNLVGNSTFYHADYVSPRWSRSFQRVAKVDTHIFYEK